MRKAALQIIGIIVAVFVVLLGVGYSTSVPRQLKTPDVMSDLDELKALLDELTGYDQVSVPRRGSGLSTERPALCPDRAPHLFPE